MKIDNKKSYLKQDLEELALFASDHLVRGIAKTYFFVDSCVLNITNKKNQIKRRFIP